jgi:hypothetical protein
MSASTDKRFPDDHVIETLRGARVPNSGRVLRTFADRASWLVRKIEGYQDRARDPKASYLVEELSAIAVAIELVENKRSENIAAYDTIRMLRQEIEQLRVDLAAATVKERER